MRSVYRKTNRLNAWLRLKNFIIKQPKTHALRIGLLFFCGFSPWSTIKFLFEETRWCFTQNHPLCGCALIVIQKYVIPIYNSKCSSHYCKEKNDVLIANKTNKLSHSKWVCKYHIVFAMIFSIIHRCVNSIEADFCSM